MFLGIKIKKNNCARVSKKQLWGLPHGFLHREKHLSLFRTLRTVHMSLISLGAIDEGLHARLTLGDSLAGCLMLCAVIFEWLIKLVHVFATMWDLNFLHHSRYRIYEHILDALVSYYNSGWLFWYLGETTALSFILPGQTQKCMKERAMKFRKCQQSLEQLRLRIGSFGRNVRC